MKILVCGGRNYGHVVRTTGLTEDEPPETQERLKEYKRIHYALNELAHKHSKLFNPNDNWLPTDITIISGGATGADSAAIDFAICAFCQFKEYKADWTDLSHPDAVIRTRRDGTKYDAKAGHRRNQQMIDEGKPDLVVAFPGGKGTADMVARAKKAGIPVVTYE